MTTISHVVLSKAGAGYHRNDIPIGSIGVQVSFKIECKVQAQVTASKL